MATANTIDVLGIGAVAVDDLAYVDAFPPPDAKVRVQRRERHCGGLTATALVTAARLGAHCAYAGVLGNDELSNFALARLKDSGVNISWVQRRASAGPVYSNIIVDRRCGTRNIFYDLERVRGSKLHPSEAMIGSCKVLLVDHIHMESAIHAARLARLANIPVVADLEKNESSRFQELIKLADHLILSQEFATALTGKKSPEKAVCRLACPSREVSVVTCGDKGCWYLARNWASPKYLPAFQVKVVDTTGCGDVFHGAYAFALARDLALEERIRLSAATAALKAVHPGGQEGIPSLQTVRRFLNHELESKTH